MEERFAEAVIVSKREWSRAADKVHRGQRDHSRTEAKSLKHWACLTLSHSLSLRQHVLNACTYVTAF